MKLKDCTDERLVWEQNWVAIREVFENLRDDLNQLTDDITEFVDYEVYTGLVNEIHQTVNWHVFGLMMAEDESELTNET